MSEILIPGGGGGITSSDVTATKAHILKGEKTVTSDSNDEIVEGTMTVNSLLSFSCAAYSGRRVLAKWQNPKAASGKPYSGVYIRYSTSGYPGKTGGTQIYKGAGNNTASEGQSQAYIDLPNLNTTYYLSIYPYVTANVYEMTGNVLNVSVKTLSEIYMNFTATQTYVPPAGYTRLEAFCLGGGGGGAGGDGNNNGGGGGGGGCTSTKRNISIKDSQPLAISVGAGGGNGSQGGSGSWGGTSSIIFNGVTLCSASGGQGGIGGTGGKGGSGGGGAGIRGGNGGNGGSNGSNGTAGYYITSINGGGAGGTGQGGNTYAWGASTGTLYSGGGGGGGAWKRNNSSEGGTYIGSGGIGGSGYGAGGGRVGWEGGTARANTGGGGGGGGASGSSTVADKDGGKGGSGIVLIKLY